MRRPLQLLLSLLTTALLLAWLFGSNQPVRHGDAKAEDATAGPAADVVATAEPLVVPEVGERSRAVDGAATLRALVVDASQHAVVDCLVLAFRDGEVEVAERRTDHEGAAEFPASDVLGGLVAVARDGRFGLLHPVPMRGQQRLSLSGANLSASVFVDGVPAPSGLEFGLRTTSWGLPDTAPEAVIEQLQTLVGSRTSRTDAHGDLVFAGLPDGVRGTLVLPSTCWRSEVPDSVLPPRYLELPGAGHHVLHLVGLPTVRGTVRWEDGVPVASGLAIVSGGFDGGIEATGSAPVGSDGRFELGLAPVQVDQRGRWLDVAQRPRFARGTLRVLAAGSTGDGEVALSAPSLGTPFEVVLRRAEVRHVVVCDQRGAPIAGARLDCPGSAPTDARGRTTCFGEGPNWVGAPGFAMMRAQARAGDGGEAAPFEYRVPAQNRLVFQVVASGGERIESWNLEIETLVPWAEAGGDGWAIHAACGGSEVRMLVQPVGDASTHRMPLRTDRRGRAVVHSLSPGERGRARLLDGLGVEVANVAFVVPGFGEERLVELALPSNLVSVRGRVERADGTPVRSAELLLLAGPQRRTVRSAADGGFQVWLARSPQPVELQVRAPGFVAVGRQDIAGGSGEVGVIRLLAGRTVTVRVVDEAGAPVDLFAMPAGFEHIQQQSLGVGEWRWPDLPSEVEFYATVSGRRFSAFAGPGVDGVVLRAPQVALVWAPHAELPADVGVAAHEACVLLHAEAAPAAAPECLDFWPNDSNALRVMPGRYRAELARRRRSADGGWRFESLGITRTVELPAGERMAVRF